MSFRRHTLNIRVFEERKVDCTDCTGVTLEKLYSQLLWKNSCYNVNADRCVVSSVGSRFGVLVDVKLRLSKEPGFQSVNVRC